MALIDDFSRNATGHILTDCGTTEERFKRESVNFDLSNIDIPKVIDQNGFTVKPPYEVITIVNREDGKFFATRIIDGHEVDDNNNGYTVRQKSNSLVFWKYVLESANRWHLYMCGQIPYGEHGLMQHYDVGCFLYRNVLSEKTLLNADEFSGIERSAVAYCLQLMHCKNIKHVEIDPTQNPAYKRHNVKRKEPLKKYYVLDLVVPGEKTTRQSSATPRENGIRAAHLCRGHFSTYTNENKLFGKHTGTYWVPAHMRGNKKNGEIEKSYRLIEATN